MASSRNKPSTEGVIAACRAVLAAHVPVGGSLTVALSGGVDSATLLHLVHRLASTAGWGVAALHVHHGLSTSADDWAAACGALCRDIEVPLRVERVMVERGSADGLEAAARRARHAAYARAAGDFIVLGHHRGDQAETLLFNLMRGTGLAGAAAMDARQGRILRPLLALSRDDIVAYAQAHGIPWVDDESNRDTGYSRNFIRHDVLAPLRRRFPAVERKLAAAADRFGEAERLLDELAQIDLAGHADFPVAVATLEALSEERARNVLRYLLARRGVGIPSQARLVEALRQLVAAADDRHPRIAFGAWAMVRRRGRVDLERAA